jgi:hypothetical protein
VLVQLGVAVDDVAVVAVVVESSRRTRARVVYARSLVAVVKTPVSVFVEGGLSLVSVGTDLFG